MHGKFPIFFFYNQRKFWEDVAIITSDYSEKDVLLWSYNPFVIFFFFLCEHTHTNTNISHIFKHHCKMYGTLGDVGHKQCFTSSNLSKSSNFERLCWHVLGFPIFYTIFKYLMPSEQIVCFPNLWCIWIFSSTNCIFFFYHRNVNKPGKETGVFT